MWHVSYVSYSELIFTFWFQKLKCDSKQDAELQFKTARYANNESEVLHIHTN